MKDTVPSLTWVQSNQRYLMREVATVGQLLEARGGLVTERSAASGKADILVASGEGTSESAPPAPAARSDVTPGRAIQLTPPALDVLCSVFQLSSFERSVLLLCAGMELDQSFGPRCAAAQDDPAMSYPTFSLALAALPDPHWSAVTPGAPLRFWRLVEMANHNVLTSARLRLDERVLHFLTGANQLDERLRVFVDWQPSSLALSASQSVVADEVSAVLSTTSAGGILPVIQLCSGDVSSARAVAAAVCSSAGLHLMGIRHEDLPSGPVERDTLCRLWEREAFLGKNAIFLDAEEASVPECVRTLLPFVENTRAIIFVRRLEPLRGHSRPLIRFDVRGPSPAEQHALWRLALGDEFSRFNGEVDKVVANFNLGSAEIAAASAGLSSKNDQVESRLWEACRVQGRARLEDLAQRVEPFAGWDDLVLPEPQRQMLKEISANVGQRMKVYETWGFAGKGARGLGVSTLFAGASGTGKTMAAEVLAGELRLDLYRIDLSSVVSKYIGETEKNLRRVFDAAESGGAILLFDEADALFGKRSEVKDSHDRYANIEVSYLLQRMEAYRGLAILTTNMKEALDAAFLRRLRFIVQFPFPDAARRAEIWRRIFPKQTPTEGIDPCKLARLNMTGGSIRNIALNAAFLAADAGEPVSMGHLVRAARSECQKLETPLPQAELSDWL